MTTVPATKMISDILTKLQTASAPSSIITIGSQFSTLLDVTKINIGKQFTNNSEALIRLCVILSTVCDREVYLTNQVKEMNSYLQYIPSLMKTDRNPDDRVVVATFGGAVSAIHGVSGSSPGPELNAYHLTCVLPLISLHYFLLHNSIRIPSNKGLIAAHARSIFAHPNVTTIMQNAFTVLQNLPSREFDIRFTLIKIYKMDTDFSNETQLKMYELVMKDIFHGTMLYGAA
jgi:hypothetical protein